MSDSYITHAGGTIEPAAIEEYEVSQDGGNLIHPILGRIDPDVTYRPAGLRAGTLALSFDNDGDAEDARSAHVTGTVFTFVAPSRPSLDMLYVLAPGGLRKRRESSGRTVLTVEFQEVYP